MLGNLLVLRFMKIKVWHVATVLFASSLLAISSPANSAPYDFTSQASERPLAVVVNQTMVIEFGSDVSQAIIGDPATADVLPISARAMYVQGKKFGTTNLTVFSPDRSRQIMFTVQVTPDIAALKRTFADVAPGVDVKVTSSNGRLILSGEVPDAVTADRLTLVSKDFAENVTNAMIIRSGQQVMLEVWFLEARRGAMKEFGVNLSGFGANSNLALANKLAPAADIVPASGPIIAGATPLASYSGIIRGTNMNVQIEALENRNLVRKLANPNLVAISGKKAYFNSGGKLPYTSTNGVGASNTQFVSYGININFLPTVLSKGVINLEVNAGVSSPNMATGGIDERVAETAVELRDGESLMIAGLTDSEMMRNVDQSPFVGDIPILGALFRSSDFANKESELVMVITPHIVTGVANLSSIKSPLDKRKLTSESTFFGNGTEEIDRPVAPARKQPKAQAPQAHMLNDEGAQ